MAIHAEVDHRGVARGGGVFQRPSAFRLCGKRAMQCWIPVAGFAGQIEECIDNVAMVFNRGIKGDMGRTLWGAGADYGQCFLLLGGKRDHGS